MLCEKTLNERLSFFSGLSDWYGYFLEHLPYLALPHVDHFFYFIIQFCLPVQVWKTTAACCLTITRKMQIYKQFIATQWQVFFRIVSNWLDNFRSFQWYRFLLVRRNILIKNTPKGEQALKKYPNVSFFLFLILGLWLFMQLKLLFLQSGFPQ